MTAIDRLINYYNGNSWHPQTNPGGILANGHRANYVSLLKDSGEVGESEIGATAEVTRLRTFYSIGDYPTAPGGFGNAGNRYNYVPSLQDVADVALDMGLSSAAISRLDLFYS